ncbi:MAG: right-handed parallel beta-helix repeat-containing protein [Ignavibacteria bacterium]|nr:right-handed parallel beta-helix repeat-containing protein [Ignavibacteria bacterium]
MNGVTLPDWQLVNFMKYDQNSVAADPVFENPPAGNMKPQATGPNDIGTDLTAFVSDDITGASRPAASDPGAWEFTPSGMTIAVTASQPVTSSVPCAQSAHSDSKSSRPEFCSRDADGFQVEHAGSTTPADLDSAKLYYTGASSTFATGTLWGSGVYLPHGPFTISGSQVLSPGTHYYWLTYKRRRNAPQRGGRNLRSAGSVFTPSPTSPAGARYIKSALSGTYSISHLLSPSCTTTMRLTSLGISERSPSTPKFQQPALHRDLEFYEYHPLPEIRRRQQSAHHRRGGNGNARRHHQDRRDGLRDLRRHRHAGSRIQCFLDPADGMGVRDTEELRHGRREQRDDQELQHRAQQEYERMGHLSGKPHPAEHHRPHGHQYHRTVLLQHVPDNLITGTYNGIRVYGASADTTYYDHGTDLGASGGNTVTNWAGSSTAAYGIYAGYQDDMRVANNSVNTVYNHTTSLYGIYLTSGTNVNLDAYNNTVSISDSGTTGTMYGFYNSMGSTGTEYREHHQQYGDRLRIPDGHQRHLLRIV